MDKLNKTVILIFDEIALSEQLTFDSSTDKVVGYVDLGHDLGRRNEFANHALVFMIHGLRKVWKQPVAYYFSRGTIKTNQLIPIIKEVIVELQNSGLKVLATVCDQGPTNRAAIRILCNSTCGSRYGPFFFVNNQKIITLFDVPHLLKALRNAFLKYNIQFDKTKFAKLEHVIKCFNIDKTKRFQGLRKIREMYFYVNKYNSLKMKVSVAARTLSNTVASFIECMISGNLGLPSEAIYTAEFIHDIDTLFDSFNGRTPTPEIGKPYRRCLSAKSRHHGLWDRMLSKINSWVFFSKDGKSKKDKIPFKNGWLTTIKGTIELFKMCQKMGFKYLRTRSLNQDPIENLFAGIRQYGSTNTNPTCFQFISALKTSVLNSLIEPHARNQN
ncbi:hypothetical protein NQ317_007691 [Molorchus minor]|uniref:Transposase n=1 Tax=Molorchus minor TaxID=1323400 RepID=A0ABQ9JP58_9CUCU|nr:hypothetical protein NQ317_007691 [Molorchus minor]